MLMIASVVTVAIVATALWFSPMPVSERIGFRNFFGAALLVAWVAGVGANAVDRHSSDRMADDSELMSAVRTLGPIDWDGSGARRSSEQSRQQSARINSANRAASNAALDVAPVGSLITGLEQRLAAGPEDANGWALLAQSYAFIGRMDQAEAAVAKAVELGFDEASLRDRVEGSQREVHAGNWIDQTISQ